MKPISPRVLLLLLSFTSLVAAANFTQCLDSFKTNPNTTSGGVDSQGRDVSPADAVGLRYETCTQLCGRTAESFDWRQFAQLFNSWLLPWLALLSQLPFGSADLIDDFVSIFMSVGSPALAAYSLMVTAFNTRMVYKKANQIPRKGKLDVAKALIALQQTAIKLTADTYFLKLILDDGKWGDEIIERLNKRNAWSLTTGFSVAWAVIAFVFTLVDSFVSLSDPQTNGSEGLAVGILWLWLLCLVIGWLWIPIYSYEEVNAALHHANIKAVETAAGNCKHEVASPLTAQDYPKTSKKPDADPDGDEKQGLADEGETRAWKVPELKSTSPRAPTESQQDQGIGEVQTPQRSSAEVQQQLAAVPFASLKPGPGRLFIPKKEGDPLHSDEFRHSATFNYSRIMWYLALVDDVFGALERPVIADEEKRPFSQVTDPSSQITDPVSQITDPVSQITDPVSQITDPSFPKRSPFPPGALVTMFKSVIFALLLQVGITGAAMVIMVFTPTVGLGCRSLAYTIHGGIAILIMFLSIISTILTRISETRQGETHQGETPHVEGVTAFFAITLRWICYMLALINSVGLIVLSCLQFSNFLDNCYCNSSVLSKGTNTYIIIILQDLVPMMRDYRAVGIGISAGTIFIFMFALSLISTPPKESKDI